MPGARPLRASARTSSSSTSCSRRSPRATRNARAATRGSSSWGRGARTRPRWSTSSWCDALVVRLTLAYRGGGFSGWAAQPGLRTVEAELRAALERILQAPVALTVAGRTDAGVHAWGQVTSFEHSGDLPDGLARRVNAVAPDDLAVIAAEPAPDGFDARRDARSREYCYRVLASPVRSPFEQGRALWWPHRIEVAELERCAALLPGAHDFPAFTPTETEHVRFDRDILRAEWVREPLTRSATGVGRVPSGISSQGDQPPSGA